jgi:hypothetical protein
VSDSGQEQGMAISGTLGDLRKLRGAWHRAAIAAGTLSSVPGFEKTAAIILAEAERLGATTVYIQVPCIVCRQYFPEPFQVGSEKNEEPNCCLCGVCNALIDREIRAKHPGTHMIGKEPGMLCGCPDRESHLAKRADHLHTDGTWHEDFKTHRRTISHRHLPGDKIEWKDAVPGWRLQCPGCRQMDGMHAEGCEEISIPRLVDYPGEVVHEHQSRHDPGTGREPGCPLCASWRHPSVIRAEQAKP